MRSPVDTADTLKREGFRFNGVGKYWHRTLPTDTDVTAALADWEWFLPPVVVEVVDDGTLVATHTA